MAILHNPNSKHRSPLALWVSKDGMKSWTYCRVLVTESVDGPDGRLNYPGGFISQDSSGRTSPSMIIDTGRSSTVPDCRPSTEVRSPGADSPYVVPGTPIEILYANARS